MFRPESCASMIALGDRCFENAGVSARVLKASVDKTALTLRCRRIHDQVIVLRFSVLGQLSSLILRRLERQVVTAG